MPSVVLCTDGLETALSNEEGMWIEFRTPGGATHSRFAIDPSELSATLRGEMTFQSTDGKGNSVIVEGASGTLKVRLETPEETKRCRLSAEDVERAKQTLGIGV